ncbi:MAG: HAD-IA family hydrolase [Lachnospiraceae bacterium]|nr:HAD-IA family hydrolase [Lachnospiraceae bacterium]MDE6982197.1 HAD-IA family hydrolase [Lachnospiraceae bacterium]
MYRYQAVIFDLDGTLLDTLEDLKDSVNAALSAYGCRERSLEEVRNFVGNGIRNLMIRAVEGGSGHPEFENIFQYFKDDYKKNCKNKTKPYPGILKVLKELKDEGIKLAMVSNKADFAVKELNLYYFKDLDMLAAGEKEGVRRKPAPDGVFQILKELQVEKDQVVYVGDSDVDIQTAKNADIPCISVLWGFREKQFLINQGGTVFAETPEELLNLLKD